MKPETFGHRGFRPKDSGILCCEGEINRDKMSAMMAANAASRASQTQFGSQSI